MGMKNSKTIQPNASGIATEPEESKRIQPISYRILADQTISIASQPNAFSFDL